MMNKCLSLLLTVLLCGSVSAGVMWFYHEKYAVKIIAVDASEYIEKIGNQYRNGEIGKDGMKKKLERISEMIESLPDNAVAVSSDVVLSKNVKTIKIK